MVAEGLVVGLEDGRDLVRVTGRSSRPSGSGVSGRSPVIGRRISNPNRRGDEALGDEQRDVAALELGGEGCSAPRPRSRIGVGLGDEARPRRAMQGRPDPWRGARGRRRPTGRARAWSPRRLSCPSDIPIGVPSSSATRRSRSMRNPSSARIRRAKPSAVRTSWTPSARRDAVDDVGDHWPVAARPCRNARPGMAGASTMATSVAAGVVAHRLSSSSKGLR